MTDKNLENRNEAVADTERPHVTPADTAGDPTVPAPVWCKTCQLHVMPVGRGLCPSCRRFLPMNGMTRGESVNKTRAAKALDSLKREYKPTSEVELAQCHTLAQVIAKLETVRVGGGEHQRLVATMKDLKAALDEALATRKPPEEVLPSITTEQLYEQVEEIRAKLAVQLRREAETEQQQAEEEAAAARHALAALEAATHIEQVEPEPPAISTETPETCPHCGRSFAACATLRDDDLECWRTLHDDHPDEIERRRKERTADMLAQIGRVR